MKKNKYSLPFSFPVHAWLIVIIISCLSILPDITHAARSITERDYISERYQNFHGFVPVPGSGYIISRTDSKWPSDVTLEMSKDKSLLISLEAQGNNPAGLIMMASEILSPRVLKSVCKWDDLRFPVRFWTDRFWLPKGKCESSGCPKITFKALRGTTEIIILDKR